MPRVIWLVCQASTSSWPYLHITCCLLLCAGQEPAEEGKPEQHSSIFYMGIYAAISGAQLVMLQINFLCVVTFGIRAGR